MTVGLYRHLTQELKISRSSLDRLASRAPKMYKVYTIPKRTGGERLIAHPAKPLKTVQRELVKELSEVLPVHSSAYAYKKGVSIKDNALCHVENKYLLKMDFNNFFNSITPSLFLKICEESNLKLSEAEKRLLAGLLFWNKSKRLSGKKVLSVGAPSSPFISNLVMYEFDEAMDTLCKKESVTYTRYADDITFSTNLKGKLFSFPLVVKKKLSEIFDYQITVNDFKTIFSSKARNRHVTGITLSNEGKISIGRGRKRVLSAMIHKYTIGTLSTEDVSYLQGFLAFAKGIEPEFIKRMERKYSKSTVKEILGMVNEH